MQQIQQGINRLLSSKVTAFLKRSFFFALLYSTLLYILVRLFFYEFPFTISEGFELHSKVLLVVWIFIIACKLVFTGIVLLENNISTIKFDRVMYMSLLKKSILIMLTAALAYTVKAMPVENSKIADSGNDSSSESPIEPEMIF
jgi:hypothetical protein